MNSSLSVVFLLLLLMTYTTAAAAATAEAYKPTENFLLNCGAPSNETFQNREWQSDSFTKFIPSNAADISTTFTASSEQSSSVPQVPYTTGARIITSDFAYTFPLSPGPKFLRLYFYPALYSDSSKQFNKEDSFFSVTANEFVLLTNFSAYLTAGGDGYVRKEYVINVNDSQTLHIEFKPSPNSYAFVNGIEIVSIPTGYYIRGEGKVPEFEEINWVGVPNQHYNIPNNTALETLYRLNVGGQTVSPEADSGMFREWDTDDSYVVGLGFQTPFLEVPIYYTSLTPPYSAPKIVYTTSRIMGNDSSSVNWTFPVDSGFLYLFRLYFCEFQREIKENNVRVFSVDIGNVTAETHGDVILWTGGSRIPIYKDYVTTVGALNGPRIKTNVSMAIRPNMESQARYANAILNGLEIFKLSDPGSLAALNPRLRQLPSENSPPPPHSQKINSGAIAGAVVGGGVAVVAILAILILLQKRRRSKEISPSSVTKTSWFPFSPTSASTHKTVDSVDSLLPSDLCRRFTLDDLKSATNGFDESFVIGRGGFGKVYKGFIDNGATAVAIKRLNPESSQGIREFQTEIEMLSRLRHMHLVSLIGYCNDNGEMIVVYDYMARGTLRDHLYKSENPSLPWKKRLEICIGAAKGLQYLHTGAKWTIIHRDVKSTNILLDERWVAKVSDFGLSKVGPLGDTVSHVSTAVKGSVGYVDPEYYRRQQVTEKSDVYSFGVVLFEVLCARPAVIPTLSREKVNLAEWARQCSRRGTVDQMVDPRLTGEIAPETLNKFVEIGCNCLKDQGIDRPTMNDVVWALEFALQLQEAAEKRNKAGVAESGSQSQSAPILSFGGNSEWDTTMTSVNSGGVFSVSEDNNVALKSTTSGSATTSTDMLQSSNVFSQLNNHLGR